MSVPKVDGVLQIGIVVPDVDAAIEQYVALLGIAAWNINVVDTDAGKGRNFQTAEGAVAVKAKIAWADVGGVELELIEPMDTTSEYARYLEAHGPGVHHVMFGSDDCDGTAKRLSGAGVERILAGELQATRFHLFDARDTLGVVCEFAGGGALRPDETVKVG